MILGFSSYGYSNTNNNLHNHNININTDVIIVTFQNGKVRVTDNGGTGYPKMFKGKKMDYVLEYYLDKGYEIEGFSNVVVILVKR